jgi:hypothetical protein
VQARQGELHYPQQIRQIVSKLNEIIPYAPLPLVVGKSGNVAFHATVATGNDGKD